MIRRHAMEERYGKLGSGQTMLVINGQPYALAEILAVLGLDFEDIRPIDACYLSAKDAYVIRYYDGEERMIVAYEFDQKFRYLEESRAHIAEWMGEEYWNFGWGVWCPWTF